MKKLFLFLLCLTFIFQTNFKKEVVAKQTNVVKEIYITFDDGPSYVTTQILSTLKSHNVKATFFVVGKCVIKNPNILKSIYADGHAIGIHSYSHEYKNIYIDQNSLTQDILNCQDTITSVLPSFKAKLYRFPGGSFNLSEEIKKVPQNLNLSYYDWNASVCDAEGIDYNPYELTQNAIKTSYGRNKIILLCHDCASKHNTALALNDIIIWFKNAGYVFKTLNNN